MSNYYLNEHKINQLLIATFDLINSRNIYDKIIEMTVSILGNERRLLETWKIDEASQCWSSFINRRPPRQDDNSLLSKLWRVIWLLLISNANSATERESKFDCAREREGGRFPNAPSDAFAVICSESSSSGR